MTGNPADLADVRRRVLKGLVGAQVVAGLGTSGAAVSVLLARDIASADWLISLPPAAMIIGAAAGALATSALARRAGRRAQLAVALTVAAAGALVVVLAGVLGSFAMLIAGSIAYGVGNSAVMIARYAAADLTTPDARGRAMGTVVAATTIGAVTGPNLLAPAGHVASAIALPPLTGPYLLSAAAYLLAAAAIIVSLRPDPLHLAIRLEASPADAHDSETLKAPGALLPLSAANQGIAILVVTNLVMVAVMTMAPVHLSNEGHGLTFIGAVVSLHVAGMFAPAAVTGRLVDTFGPRPVAVAGITGLFASSLLITGGATSPAALIAGLTTLGISWNAGLVAGSALLASALPAQDRPRAQATGEASMSAAAILSTATAGPIAALAGYTALTAAATAAAAAALPVLAHRAGRRGELTAPHRSLGRDSAQTS